MPAEIIVTIGLRHYLLRRMLSKTGGVSYEAAFYHNDLLVRFRLLSAEGGWALVPQALPYYVNEELKSLKEAMTQNENTIAAGNA